MTAKEELYEIGMRLAKESGDSLTKEDVEGLLAFTEDMGITQEMIDRIKRDSSLGFRDLLTIIVEEYDPPEDEDE